jgi:hypothetical protein
MDIVQLLAADGEIVEKRYDVDQARLMQQLGVCG